MCEKTSVTNFSAFPGTDNEFAARGPYRVARRPRPSATRAASCDGTDDGAARLGAPCALQAPRGGIPRLALAPPPRHLAHSHRGRGGVTPRGALRASARALDAHPDRGRRDRAQGRGHPRHAGEAGGPTGASRQFEGGCGTDGHGRGGHPGEGCRGETESRPGADQDRDRRRILRQVLARAAAHPHGPRVPREQARRHRPDRRRRSLLRRERRRAPGDSRRTRRVRTARTDGNRGWCAGLVQLGQGRDGDRREGDVGRRGPRRETRHRNQPATGRTRASKRRRRRHLRDRAKVAVCVIPRKVWRRGFVPHAVRVQGWRARDRRRHGHLKGLRARAHGRVAAGQGTRG